ncbi:MULTISPECIES: molybdenum cofactor guanylyltransferase [unclassified Phenylobacterium]|uniref:molybdenum cofactor guanylyltransferase n=1 Tax=unclassified Phenylobacterium TaxID=2640670 RepID=UPI00083A04FD|nr:MULTISPECIES: NTP transferase domain-containing protein [unclassified Phenylobacterium]
MRGPVAVVVLAGGEGRRMGGGKPLRTFGQTTLLGQAIARARRWSPIVAVAVRARDQIAGDIDAPVLLDDPSIPGPAAGLASAFAFAAGANTARFLTLPCDAPWLPDDLLERLDAALGDEGVAVASSLGWLHPTCALWRTDCARRLPAYLATGASLRGFAADCGMIQVEWEPGPDGDPFANANTPEDLAALQPGAGLGRGVPGDGVG